MKLINIPIEPIELRYSIDWEENFQKVFEKQFNTVKVPGHTITNNIEEGRFLDCVGTNYFKSSQLMFIINLIHEGVITSGDVLFFHDLWFPGIEQLAYIRDLTGINFKITGCLHAGSYDPNDFLYQKGTSKWALHFEHCLFNIADAIFVATNYHKSLLEKSRSIPKGLIHRTGFPLSVKNCKIAPKTNTIVFPHRLDEEKCPEELDSMKNLINLKGWRWVKTAEFNDKDKYFNALSEANISISFSKQETWGIAMIESVMSGCIPIVPDRLSYKEMYFSDFRYSTFGEAVSLIKEYSNYYPFLTLSNQITKLTRSLSNSYSNICGVINELVYG